MRKNVKPYNWMKNCSEYLTRMFLRRGEMGWSWHRRKEFLHLNTENSSSKKKIVILPRRRNKKKWISGTKEREKLYTTKYNYFIVVISNDKCSCFLNFFFIFASTYKIPNLRFYFIVFISSTNNDKMINTK